MARHLPPPLARVRSSVPPDSLRPSVRAPTFIDIVAWMRRWMRTSRSVNEWLGISLSHLDLPPRKTTREAKATFPNDGRPFGVLFDEHRAVECPQDLSLRRDGA